MYIKINGNKLYYEIHGKENCETIFFIHGGPGVGDCRGDIRAFSSLEDQYKLVFIDMRGSGRSEANPPFTHKQWTADIDEFRKQLNIDKIKIFGGSYGGFLSLEYALRYPENLTHVMLRDTASNNNYNDTSIEKALKSNLPGISRNMLDRLFGGRVSSNDEFKEMFGAILPLYTVEYDEELAKTRLDSIHYHYETHNYAFHENMPKFNITEKLKEIKVPVLVTVGKHDWITPVEASEEIAAAVDKSIFVIFENSGHSPHLEENEKYVKLVREFLNK